MLVGLRCSLGAAAIAVTAVAGAAPAGPSTTAPARSPGDAASETFDHYPAEARADELARRLLTPLANRLLVEGLARRATSMRQEVLTLADERFLIRVPRTAPADGYGVLVFVPPWPDARLPAGWAEELDRAGVIFVSAERSGNGESAMGRREPLALVAAANVARRYHVDPSRTYVGGFSGGSRVALRLALAYPDVFRGALLDAGSDPVGTLDAPLPAAPLLDLLQGRSRLALVSGTGDEANVAADAGAARSMAASCIANVFVATARATGHEPAPGEAFVRALRFLDATTPAPGGGIDRCRQPLARRLADDLRALDGAIASGDFKAARRRLIEIDRRYGGMAWPELERRVPLVGKEIAF